MKTQLLITAAACLVPAFSHMSSAQEKAVDVYISSITQSFPDPAGVDDIFNNSKDSVEVTLGLVAPKGMKFIKGDGRFKIGVTDAASARKMADFNSFLTHIPDSGAFAKCPLRVKGSPAFPLKLDGVVKMTVSTGTQALPAQDVDVRKGSQFTVNGMVITVKDVEKQGKASAQVTLEFKDTLNVEDITFSDEKGAPLDAECISKGRVSIVSKGNFDMEAVPKCSRIYRMKEMPAKMKAVVVVNKGTKTIDVPLKMTVDVSRGAK